MLGIELRKKTLEENFDSFRESIYSHSLRQFGGNERKEVISSQKTRKQTDRGAESTKELGSGQIQGHEGLENEINMARAQDGAQ